MYCNTGYTLMAEIVKKTSGLTLRQFAQKNIFQPLGMNDTHFHDNYQELVPGRAYSYTPLLGRGFQHAVLSYSIVGATSLLTTVLDEAKWLNNFETGAVGGKDLLEKMYQTGTLNDGRKLTYAFALNMGKYKGWQQIGHGGGDAGFRTYACRFPEKRLGIVVFSNHGFSNPVGLTNQVADIFITNSKEEPKKEENLFTDSSILKKLPGKYYTERGNAIEMMWRDGKLLGRNNFSGNTFEMKMSEVSDNRYRIPDAGIMVLDGEFKQADSVKKFRMENPNGTLTYLRQPVVAQKITNEFAGRYYGAETEAFYYITEKDGVLTLDHRKFSAAPLKYFAPDQFTTPYWWMSHIRFIRNNRGKITAFEVNAGRIQHLRYDLVKE